MGRSFFISLTSWPRLDESTVDYLHIRSKAEVFLQDFKAAKEEDRRVAAAVSRFPWWIPPIPDQFKINFDGAVFSDLDAAGLGVVIRDSQIGRASCRERVFLSV